MRFTIFVTLSIAAGIAVAQDASPSEAKDAFDKAGMPKDLYLPAFTPSAVLAVSFPGPSQKGGQSDQTPIPVDHTGAQLPQNNTSNPPTFKIPATGRTSDAGNGPFVLAIIDPDAENGPVLSFMGGDFKFKDDGVSLTNSTPAVMEYQPPNPPQGSKTHRIAFLAFKQSDNFKDQKEVSAETSRSGFNISQFSDKVGLSAPFSGSYMLVAQAQN